VVAIEFPSLSVITICYNSETTIAKTIDSVKEQKNKNLEYILIDGCSTDKTIEIINAKNDGTFIVKSEKDKGIADAFNKGINLAKEKYILLLNSDDYLLNEVLQPCLELLHSHPEIDLLCGNMLVERQGKIITIESKPEHLTKGMSVAHPATIVKREVFQKIGLFSESYQIAMDYDFLLRCKLQGMNFYAYDKPIVFMQESGVSAQKFFLGKKEVHQIKASHNLKQSPLIVFFIGNAFRHYLGLFLSTIVPNQYYQKLRSFRYKVG
jgi:glycosyltransferase involved in cell wall biosynthesis